MKKSTERFLQRLPVQNARLLGPTGLTALGHAYECVSAKDQDPREVLLGVFAVPDLPRAYAHDYAVRMANIALTGSSHNRRWNSQSLYEAVSSKRQWIQGKGDIALLATAYENAVKKFSPTALATTTDPTVVMSELEALTGIAASVPNSARASLLSAWAYCWFRAWYRHLYWPVLKLPDYSYAVEKCRKGLRNLKLLPSMMQLDEISEAGVELEELCLKLDAVFRTVVADWEEKERSNTPDGRWLRAFYRRHEEGVKCCCFDWDNPTAECQLHRDRPAVAYVV